MLMHNHGGGFMVILWSVLKSSMRIHRNGGTPRVPALPPIPEIPSEPNRSLPPARDSNTLPGTSLHFAGDAIACAPAPREGSVSAFVRLRNAAWRLDGCGGPWPLFSRERYVVTWILNSGGGLHRRISNWRTRARGIRSFRYVPSVLSRASIYENQNSDERRECANGRD